MKVPLWRRRSGLTGTFLRETQLATERPSLYGGKVKGGHDWSDGYVTAGHRTSID